MYSVLIQNQKTMERFSRHRPLFQRALLEDRLGVCRWMEGGTSIETAVPELYEMIRPHKEWRAIILRVEDEAPMAAHPAREENPYDFLENEGGCPLGENPVPLVRLTQMLGGVPAPAVGFVPEIVTEKGKQPQLIYRPAVRPEEEQAYRALCEKYHFAGTMPCEVVLVSLRTVRPVRGGELPDPPEPGPRRPGSEFWKRNGYPSLCRFTVFEVEDRGPLQRDADLFSLWTAVLLLATNEIDASTLQAYALHRLGVELDRDALTETFQKAVSRAVTARETLRRSIRRDLARSLETEAPLPEYRLDAPVELRLPARRSAGAQVSEFGLVADTPAADLTLWNTLEGDAEADLAAVTRSADRALDQTAEHVRRYCLCGEGEAEPLTEYQQEDMDDALLKSYEEILTLRAGLPGNDPVERTRLDALAGAVRDRLTCRITRRQAVACYGAAAALLLAGLLPAAFFCAGGEGEVYGILLGAALALTLPGVAVLGLLFVARAELEAALLAFNSFVNGFITRVAENTAAFSDYMTEIASHIRGSSYLTMAARQEQHQDEDLTRKKNHLAALARYLQTLQGWCRAFYLPVDADRADPEDDTLVRAEVPPSRNELYTLEGETRRTLPVNGGVAAVESGLDFVRCLQITREELYDDAK